MDQTLELVGGSLYAEMGPTTDFLGYVPLATLKLVLVPSHSKNTHQVSHFLLYFLSLTGGLGPLTKPISMTIDRITRMKAKMKNKTELHTEGLNFSLQKYTTQGPWIYHNLH
jgi:hypothetical protein